MIIEVLDLFVSGLPWLNITHHGLVYRTVTINSLHRGPPSSPPPLQPQPFIPHLSPPTLLISPRTVLTTLSVPYLWRVFLTTLRLERFITGSVSFLVTNPLIFGTKPKLHRDIYILCLCKCFLISLICLESL